VILSEVLDVLQQERIRAAFNGERKRENVGHAIRTVAQRRRVAHWQVEQALDSALTHRRS
jgi:hypothetical protein